jgi:probable phosphoglycerate mutase
MARLVVEADGASRGNPGPASYGALVRDPETGTVLAERAEVLGTTTNNVAEYRGLIAGLEAAREIDASAEVEVRMDSKLVVEQMSGRWQVKHPSMRPLAVEARSVLPPEQVRYIWVPREKNKAADRLANAALDGTPIDDVDTSSPEARPVVDEAEIDPPVVNRLVGWSGDLGEPTRLLALRHGATAYTLEKRFSGSGQPGPGLDDVGREQVRRAASLLAARGGIDVVLSSPLRRARETADIVGAALGGAVVRVEDDLREAAFGEWDGSTFDEVSARWPDELASWLASSSVAPPGGEPLDAVARRIRSLEARLLGRWTGQTVLLVTHVTPVKLLVRDALRAPIESVFRMELAPASLTEVHWWPDGTASMRRFNETAHDA